MGWKAHLDCEGTPEIIGGKQKRNQHLHCSTCGWWRPVEDRPRCMYCARLNPVGTIPVQSRGGRELGVVHLSGCASYLRSLHGVEEIRHEESEGRRRFGYMSRTIALTVETLGDRRVAANPAA